MRTEIYGRIVYLHPVPIIIGQRSSQCEVFQRAIGVGAHPGVIQLFELRVIAIAVTVRGQCIVVERGVTIILIHQRTHAIMDAVFGIHFCQ